MTKRPMKRILCAITCVVVVVAGCGANFSGRPSVNQTDKQFAELMKRPDIDQAVARYEEMYAEVRRQLTAAIPSLQWQQTNPAGGAACGPDYAALDYGAREDAVIRGLGNWAADGNIPDAQWDHAVSVVRTVVQGYGFDTGLVVVNRPSDHEVDFHDPDQAELGFGTAVNTTLLLITGCHLTAEAKSRGHPAPLPTY